MPVAGITDEKEAGLAYEDGVVMNPMDLHRRSV